MLQSNRVIVWSEKCQNGGGKELSHQYFFHLLYFYNSSRGLLPNFFWFMFFYSFNASRDGYLVQLRTETLIVTMPTPDFSMPYNVICLACTVVALAFGPLHNITTKRYWYETESIHISGFLFMWRLRFHLTLNIQCEVKSRLWILFTPSLHCR